MTLAERRLKAEAAKGGTRKMFVMMIQAAPGWESWERGAM